MSHLTTVHATVEFATGAWGGIGSALDLMVAAALRAGQPTVLLTIDRKDSVHQLSPDLRVCRIGMPELEGGRLYRSSRRVELGRLASQRMAAALPGLLDGDEADLIVHSEELGGLLPATAARKRVFVSHGLAAQEHPDRVDLVAQERRILALAETVAVLSSAQRTTVRRLHPDVPDVRVLPMPLELLTTEIDAVDGGADEPGPIVAAGRAVPQKGFDILLRAARDDRAASLPPIVIYTGRGNADYLRLCNQLAADNGGRVTIAGWLSRKELLTAMRGASLVCVPSRFEPLGLVAAEALATGVPVVASEVGGLAELVQEPTGTGWAVPVAGPADIQGPTPATLVGSLLTAFRQAVVPTSGPQRLRRWTLDGHLAALAELLGR